MSSRALYVAISILNHSQKQTRINYFWNAYFLIWGLKLFLNSCPNCMFLFPSALQNNYLNKTTETNIKMVYFELNPSIFLESKVLLQENFTYSYKAVFQFCGLIPSEYFISGKGIEHEVKVVCACKQFNISPLFGSGMRGFLYCKTCSSWRQDSFLFVLNVTRSAEKKVTAYLHISFEGLKSGSCGGVEVV